MGQQVSSFQNQAVKLNASTVWLILQIFFGSLFFALMAQVAIYTPFSPVPITLQTVGVSILVFSLGRNKAVSALLLYLAEATLGLPVLRGGTIDPLWLAGPTAGYLIGFVASAYLMGSFINKSSSFPQKIFLTLVAEFLVLSFGTLWLSVLFDPAHAFIIGFSPFVLGSLFKAFVGATSCKPIEWIKDRVFF